MHEHDAEISVQPDCCRFPYTRTTIETASQHQSHRTESEAAVYRSHDPAFAAWAGGCGVIRHEALTQVRVYRMAQVLAGQKRVSGTDDVFRILTAADRVASAAMWLTVHLTYARRVHLDGRALSADEFKPEPDGHTGGALNMAIAYSGYLAANALSGITRAWLMGQGHSVAGVDASNVLVGNTTAAHGERYALSDEGLSRMVTDFYSYRVRPDGRPDSPLGSHVNPHTAGGLMEGGYLGFAELQYVHIPLPGEHLVVFLSDGAFEEQRGGDWAPRWWRAEDCGMVVPIMVLNGRRIEQRSGLAQEGGLAWFREHLRLNGFDPIDIDGRDPAAYAWGIFEIEERLAACASAARAGALHYPVPLPYAIAEVPKGFGFPGAGTNAAHNLPLSANPHLDADSRSQFNAAARELWVAQEILHDAVRELSNHPLQGRMRERDHPIAHRRVPPPVIPPAPWRTPSVEGRASPMESIDMAFSDIVRANPGLRVRVGNPDELRSNRMNRTLDFLKHRVQRPEPGIAESIEGSVITALNEEAVVSAALANKGGINMVVTYEAFAMKMLGAIRQEIIFARHQAEAGRPPGWLSVPIVVTSHTWENGKNEQSHQDPTFAEALLGEMSDVSRVFFAADWNSAVAAVGQVYATQGQIWTLVVPKRPLPVVLPDTGASKLARQGALRIRGHGAPDEGLILTAIGAYQLCEALRASDRLLERGVDHSVVYLGEPARLRMPRDEREREAIMPQSLRDNLFPPHSPARVVLTHTRPEPMLGLLRPIDTGPDHMTVLGYVSRGGTLDTFGMLFANRCTWAHALAASAKVLGVDVGQLLSESELQAVEGRGDPYALRGGPARAG